MRTLLLLLLLLMLASTGQSGDGSQVMVLGSKWSKQRQVNPNPDNSRVTPYPQLVTPATRAADRNRNLNNQAGVRDPNLDTIEGRSAALENIVQDSRSAKPKPVDGFLYQAKIQNASDKTIEVLFWEYQFKERANPANVATRQFLCGVDIKPGKEKELKGFTISGPSNVISVGSLDNKSANLFEEKIVINRVEYSDGTIWQRKDWNFSDVRQSIARALKSPWEKETCKSL
ncbi:MAG: hypothetical protein ICV60_13750 [Pyrinomonadaceae bacterium]|nr:hypothetical protein [Pyrinomonadaceae bacterium]